MFFISQKTLYFKNKISEPVFLTKKKNHSKVENKTESAQDENVIEVVFFVKKCKLGDP